MAFRPDEEEPRLTIKLTNTERAEESGAQAGEGNLISDAAAVKFEQDDFTDDVKMKLGEYLKCEIDDEANQSEARIRYKPPRLPRLNDADADAPSQPGDNSFSANMSQRERTEFERTTNSGQFAFDISVRRGEAVSDDNEDPAARVSRTRIGLYSDVEERRSVSILAEAAENLVDENARFSPKAGQTPYVTPDRPSEDDAGTGSHIFQQRFGIHGPRKFPTRVEADPEVSIQDMKNLGFRILLKSSGEVFVPEDTSQTDQVAAARVTSTLVPGLARLGLRQNFSRFSATETLNDAVPDAQKASVDIDLEGNAIPSYGNVNNPLAPFSAISSASSSVIVGTLLVLTVSGLLQALAELLDSDIPSNLSSSDLLGGTTGDTTVEDAIRQRLGSFRPKEVRNDTGLDRFTQFIGLSGFQDILLKTDNDYGKAVERGTQIFFGLEQGDFFGSLGANIGSAAIRITESPGFWNTILRSMVRSFTDPLLSISNGFAGVAGENVDVAALEKTNYDVDPFTGPPNDPFALLESVNIIKESRLLKVMNLIAAIGDIALNTDNGEFVSEIDSIPDVTTVSDEATPSLRGERINPAALVKKNRLSERVNSIKPGAAGALAWGTSTLPSLYMLNTNRQLAEKLYTGETTNFDEVFSRTKKDTKKQNQPRLPKEIVRAIEEELDSYYVPFYFHDLRTNEIIALHAFLDNMADSFNVDMAETQGYGRIGNVYSYKNTIRNISISFKIIATNKEDFDQMWYKINKIVMFCFPQYTLGRTLSFDDENGQTYNFVQPFSQLPSSSPMIRLRIGDVFKSNYSDIDLARLHGLGQRAFSTPLSEDAAIDEQQQERIDQKIEEITRRQKEFEFLPGESFFFNKSYEIVGSRQPSPGSRDGLVINVSAGGVGFGGGFGAPPVQPPGGISDPTEQSRVTIPPGTKATVDRLLEGGGGRRYAITLEPQSDNIPTNLEVNFARATQSSVIALDYAAIYSRAVSSVDPTGGALAGAGLIGEEGETRQQVQAFFSPNADGETVSVNPIFKSFESTRGEGIPGFVRSISFDWNDAVWETETLNSRAPKWVTVQMEFAPIYDINPGLDVDGNMIGAIYNVGDIMRRLKLNRETALSNDIRRMRFNRRKGGANN